MTRVKAMAALASLCGALLSTPCTVSAAPSAGVTIDFAPDALDDNRTGRSWRGRAYLHPSIVENPSQPRPVIVFMHGLNKAKIPYRWMGGAADPDVRDMVSNLIDRQIIAPAILVAPTTTSECDVPRSMWPAFDLNRFLALAFRNLEPTVAADRLRILLVGHSGAACNTAGGMLTAVRSGFPLQAVLAIDTCMDAVAAPLFAVADPNTDVVISWQPLGWDRPFDAFERSFLESSAKRRARGLRTVHRHDVSGRNPHGGIVEIALARWLPRWIAPKTE
jgi:hypothetical protein